MNRSHFFSGFTTGLAFSFFFIFGLFSLQASEKASNTSDSSASSSSSTSSKTTPKLPQLKNKPSTTLPTKEAPALTLQPNQMTRHTPNRTLSKEELEKIEKEKNWLVDGLKNKREQALTLQQSQRELEDQQFQSLIDQEREKIKIESQQRSKKDVLQPALTDFSFQSSNDKNKDSTTPENSKLKLSDPNVLPDPNTFSFSNTTNDLRSPSSEFSSNNFDSYNPNYNPASLSTPQSMKQQVDARGFKIPSSSPSQGNSNSPYRKISSDPNYKPNGFGDNQNRFNNKTKLNTTNPYLSPQQTKNLSSREAAELLRKAENKSRRRPDTRPTVKKMRSLIPDPTDEPRF